MKSVNKIILFFVLCISSFTLLAQTKIKGKVTDGKEPIIGANITIKGTTEGTVSDLDGKFELSTNQATPLTLVISMVGMATSEVKFDGSQEEISVSMSEETSLLNDVVVAASRVEEKILESPVTIEKMDPKAIKTAAAADYYDDLAKLKGVQTINGSMTLTSVNTRGFGGISNTRFVQLMDGMDNAAPLLNFPTGNIVGIGELDINNVELVPGAASALYGPNAFNGILLMNSKNPFEQPGFSMQVKGGFAQANNGYGVKPLGSAALRIAHAFKSKKTGQDFAAIKANFSIFQGTDWYANDYTTDRSLGTQDNVGNPNFDGLNLYGDEARIFVPYGAVRGNLIGSASNSLQNSPLFQAGVTAAVTAQVNAQLPAITTVVTATVRQQAYDNAIAGGADVATANTMADAYIASPAGQATIQAHVQAQVQALIDSNVATQLPIQANARATSKVDSISSLLSLDLRRSGLSEDRLLDNHKAQSIKGDFGAYFRPFKDKSYEFSYNYRIGFGNSVYQGSERYALRNFLQQFHKAEIKSKDFFIRSYMSQTKDGDTYNLSALGAYSNEAVSPSGSQWVPTYLSSYAGPLIGAALQTSAANVLANAAALTSMAHDTARARADRPWNNLTAAEQQAVIESVRTGLFQRGGAGFIDNSRLFHTEAMLDLTRWTGKWIDIQIGGNHRLYSLSTQGTVFNEDPNGTGQYKRIKINEYGAFLQLQRKFYKDMFKIQASVRFDKNQNFKLIISPRAAFVATLGKDRNHNIRVSYQTGFRNPDSQAQYIYFPTTNILLGGTKQNAERYGIYNGGAYTMDSYNEFVATALAGAPDVTKLVVSDFDYVKPEQLQVVELGYKSVLFKKLMIDVNGYFNIYKDFITQITVVSIDSTYHKGVLLPGVAQVISGSARTATTWRPYVNIPGKTFSYGAGIGIGYALPKNIMARVSYNYMDYKIKGGKPSVGTANDLGFNSSKHQVFVGFSGDRVWKGLGFAIDYRWQSAIDWSSDFADGTVKARGMLDASLSYFVEKAMTTFKIGATNIAGPTYRTNVGGPFIGRTFFAAITFDQNKLWKEHHNEVTGAKEF
ncbi:MAG TPA: carboxypeptidase-like regulatory domain-containing protein [Chitinophagales bacterium]|nr:carboxypeptidase-like regulatory domain-containing protein [Chitinophagales bacterium]